MSLDACLQRIWYGRKDRVFYVLRPLSWLLALVVALRVRAFRSGWLRSTHVSRPTIVVGNITVGGTGKTPFTIWLASKLTQNGHKVGVITKGYGGKADAWPRRVRADSDPAQLGDESVLIAQQCAAIVVAGPDRVAAAQHAVDAGAEVIISDDGLQHYRLRRDCELAVVDGARLFGNGCLLPAGPLREPANRLRHVQLVLVNLRGGAAMPELGVPAVAFRVAPLQLRSLATGERKVWDHFKGQGVHIVTAIGHPEAFIASIRAQGLAVDARVLADHAALSPADIEFNDALPVLMTEKDAVKCRGFVDSRHWAVETEVHIDEAAAAQVLDCVRRAIHPVR